jgi:hypothetical protein
MFAVAGPITDADGPVGVILGLGVSLAFAGVVVRALTQRWAWHACRRGRDTAAVGSAPAVARETDPRVRDASDVPGPRSQIAAKSSEPEVARLSRQTLAPLARVLDASRRLCAAEDRVADELGTLADGYWLVERGVFVDGRRIPLLVMGATGVFLVCPSDGAWTLHDLVIMSGLADEVRLRLPDYEGRPHVAVCLAFDAMRPREWFGGEQLRGRGGWVLGADWLQRWIFAFGPEHGLRNGDIRRLDEASGPLWECRSTARLPVNANHG